MNKHDLVMFLLGMLSMSLIVSALGFALLQLWPCVLGVGIVAALSIWTGWKEAQR